MKRKEFLKRKIDSYLKKEQLSRNQEHKKLEKPYLLKARKSYSIGNLLFGISESDEIRKILKLADNFDAYDWATIVAYYSMYTSALAAIAKLGFKSKSHAATISVLELNYVQNKDLEIKDIQKLEQAHAISEDLINKLIKTKTKRETAQYNATASISRENAKTALEDAEEFISKIEEILS